MLRKILVVDQKPFMMRLIQLHLERAGYQLIKARNRVEAIAALEQQSPELVVMDDDASSTQLACPLETSKTNSKQSIPVIRMTDIPQNSKEDVIEAEVVLTKPFSPTQLVSEVKRLVHDA